MYESECFIQKIIKSFVILAFLFAWQPNQKYFPKLFLNGRGRWAHSMTKSGCLSLPSELYHARKLIHVFSFLVPCTVVAHRNHPGGWRKNRPSSSALCTYVATKNAILSQVLEKCRFIAGTSDSAASLCTWRKQIPWQAWKLLTYLSKNDSDSCFEKGALLSVWAWDLSAKWSTIVPFICSLLTFLERTQLQSAVSNKRDVDLICYKFLKNRNECRKSNWRQERYEKLWPNWATVVVNIDPSPMGVKTFPSTAHPQTNAIALSNDVLLFCNCHCLHLAMLRVLLDMPNVSEVGSQCLLCQQVQRFHHSLYVPISSKRFACTQTNSNV